MSETKPQFARGHDAHELVQAAIYERIKCTDDEAYTIADVVLSHPNIALSVTLAGEPADIEEALGALPVGTIVRSSDEAIADGGCRAWAKEAHPHRLGEFFWAGTGGASVGAAHLARHFAPLTVIA